MPEEENPFLVKKRKAETNTEKKDDEPMVFDFMVKEKDAKGPMIEPAGKEEKPHYESAGTPIWDKDGVDTSHIVEEVVEHDEKKKKKEK
jgi:hypothetical protein